ncbi:MAG: protein kinase [Gemmatimonas sp.]|uniref:serine/threonine-protein kinase n=1 Tax=Gemmatimonas sp. TaxID=1962908 RepID=UPI0022CC2CBA|nr:serine/threonine-protein kinase [Gemmatimonas sp.]MCZ8013472.1 protein kinase [Gemmatimonas sp.]MCZ8268018.1 protein kinase [Gemmatimonas sp.]
MSSAPIDPSFIALQSAVAGRFSLESELGRGGMGIVYLARDVILERPVAIKLLAPALAAREDMRRRFLREARLAAQCFHPNIVPIHEVAEAGDLAWFVMAYVAGESLADRLRRVGPLPAEDVRRLGREIGWALAYAHERGVVHRDVKPENILLERGTERALIADFGIAISHHGPSHSGEVAGTARYMAPEQALGETVDGRADLYALGVTLYVAATGTYPYDGQSLVAIVAQQSAQPAPSVRMRAPRLSAAVADAIDQCLAIRPSERFDDVARFVQALERTPDGGELPVEARATRVAATGAGTLADWTFAIGYAAFFMVMGEESGSFGRMIMRGVAEGVLTFAAIATAVRGVEAVLAARTALQRGVAPDDVADALAPPPEASQERVGTLKTTVMLAGASALALAQAGVDLLGLPGPLEFLGNVITVLTPPVIIQRALASARRESGMGALSYAFVRKPLARRVVGWLGGAPAARPARALPATAPTEVLLGDAANAIFARLPHDARNALAALPAATAALARDAMALRARADELSAEHRRVRQAPHEAATLLQLEAERAEVQARLGTAIAALENIRLDLLRLEANRTLPGQLTQDLEVVRELQRHVDAMQEVNRALRPRWPEPTPV